MPPVIIGHVALPRYRARMQAAPAKPRQRELAERDGTIVPRPGLVAAEAASAPSAG